MTSTGLLRSASCGEGLLAGEGFCEACGAPVALAVPDYSTLDLGTAAVVSDRGLVHHHNQDAFALLQVHDAVAAVVCDGVSASVAADLAARTAATAVADALRVALERADHPALADGFDAHAAMRHAMGAAQDAVGAIRFAPDDPLAAPSCTLVAALCTGGVITVGSVGDSRAYWIADEDARCLTVDDSWAQSQVTQGLATEAEVASDPRAHAITHWIGADAPSDPPQVVSFRPATPGLLVVCTDGLWGYLPSPDALADAVRTVVGEPPASVARELVRTAIARGGSDNVTVAVVAMPQFPDEEEVSS